VISEEGGRIGEVKDFVVEPSSWQVKALDVELFANVADEFRMKKLLRSTRVPIEVEHVKSVGDHVILKVSKAQLKSIIVQGATSEKIEAAAASQ
jgi:sporulation protein YlmC with PRC-barrel domain